MENLKTNRHHLLSPRREYIKAGGFAYMARTHPVLIRKIPVVDHTELHWQTDMPGVITDNLALETLEELAMSQGRDKNERFDRLMEHYFRLSRGVGRIALEAGELYDNFGTQIPFLERAED